MEDFKNQVKSGFQKCRSDIEVVSISNSKLEAEVSELKEENSELKSLIREMSSQLNELKGEVKGMNIALEYIKSFNQAQIISNQNSMSVPIQQTIAQPIFQEEQPIKKERKVPEYKDSYEALLAFKAKSNKRELLKQKMIQTLEENDGMVLSELKFLFVDHYRYCSKASFYNYLKEVELEKYIQIQRDGGKNKIYLSRPEIIRQSSFS